MAGLGSRFYQEATRYMKHDSRGLCGMIREGLETDEFKPQDFSIRRLAEATIGREFVDACGPGGGSAFMEAAGGAVDTGTFSNITGQIVYSMILDSYTDPAFVGDQLCTKVQTQFNGEKIPGVSRMGDDAENITEGGEYPLVGLGQSYIETPSTEKTGMIVPVTKEAIFFDRTGLVLQRAAEVGYWLGVNKEKEIISIATGTTNNFSRNGTSYNTYAASGGHGIINQQTNALVDWTDLNETYILFADMTDWDTAEPIIIIPQILFVPHSLLATAHYILSSTQVRGGTSNSTAYQTISTDPVKNMMPLTVLSTPMFEAVTSESNDWYVGDFKKAFLYMSNWDITQEISSGPQSEWAFTRDIVQRYKVSERGVAAVKDPHYVVKSTGGS
jgi:hypothetical protein